MIDQVWTPRCYRSFGSLHNHVFQNRLSFYCQWLFNCYFRTLHGPCLSFFSSKIGTFFAKTGLHRGNKHGIQCWNDFFRHTFHILLFIFYKIWFDLLSLQNSRKACCWGLLAIWFSLVLPFLYLHVLVFFVSSASVWKGSETVIEKGIVNFASFLFKKSLP